MAVLTRDEYIRRIQERMSETPTDDEIAFLEDMTDTYDSLTPTGESVDWEAKYNELDATWRKRYTDRFNGDLSAVDDIEFIEHPGATVYEDEERPTRYEDLFVVEGK